MNFGPSSTGKFIPTPASLLPRTAWRATGWYAVATAVMTWPVVTAIRTGVPSDLGDPLLNCWIIGWNAKHFLAALGGHLGALGELWHGNMFYPERYTLAYSELLIAQSVQALPIYAVTGNLLLCYNLLFLSTFLLSGVGMFLLVRAFTADWRVAFIAGLLYAFTPYRLYQAPHLQVMSTQWMPFALLGFHRAAASRRIAPALGGGVALVAQNLSCGYFLIYFSLFVPVFVAFELARHGRLLDRRTWFAFGMAAVLVAACTLPFMSPYFALRELRQTVRSVDELKLFSADSLGWVTAPKPSTLWGGVLEAGDKPEGALFPGATPLLFLGIGVASAWRRARRKGRDGDAQPARHGWRVARGVAQSVGWLLLVLGIVTGAVILGGGSGVHYVLGFRIRISRLYRAFVFLATGLAVLAWASRSMRVFWSRAIRSPFAFAAIAAVAAAYLSLGPVPAAAREDISAPTVFMFFLNTVPGFDGLRVPARFAAVAIVFLVVAAGAGLRDLLNAARRHGGMLSVALSVLVLVDAAMLPFGINRRVPSITPTALPPPPMVATGSNAPRIYRAVQDLPANAVLLEMPIGDEEWEFRHVFYSTTHWRHMVNGYSGYVPKSYAETAAALRDPYRDPEVAWDRLRTVGVTHVVVHGIAYRDDRPPAPYAWLEAHGATQVAVAGADRMYEVPR